MSRPTGIPIMALVVASAILFATPVAGVAQECPVGGWPTTDFEVRSYRDIPRDQWPAGASDNPLVVGAWERNRTLFPQTPSAADAALDREVEGHLQDIAQRLRAAGFGCPRLPTVVKDGRIRYLVYVLNFSEDPEFHTRPPSVHGMGAAPGSSNPNLFLNRESFKPTSELRRPIDLYVIAAHELFHVVQSTYDAHYLSILKPDEGGQQFVLEGSATGVAAYLLSQRFPGMLEKLGPNHGEDQTRMILGGFEYWNSVMRLDSIHNSRHTGSFWFHLAERYGGLSVVESLLRRPVGQSTEAARIRWLDAGLFDHPNVRKGFGPVFSHFVTELASYGSSRYQGVTEKTWLAWILYGCGDLGTGLSSAPPESSPTEVRRAWWPDPLESSCVSLKWSDFPNPAVLEVEVTAADAVSLNQIHLGLANGSMSDGNCWGRRASTPNASCVIEDIGAPLRQNDKWIKVWHISLEDGGPEGDATVVLTNVAERYPWNTKPAHGLEVRVRVQAQAASMSTWSAPSVDIDETTRFDWISGNIVNVSGVCALRIKAHNSGTGDTIAIQLDRMEPIGPGAYGVSRSPAPVILVPEKAPGTFVGGFTIGDGNPLSGGRAQEFWLHSGMVEITSVSGRFVQGLMRVNGWRTRCCLPGTAEPFGLESVWAGIRFAFVANQGLLSDKPGPRSSSERIYIGMARGCLQQTPIPPNVRRPDPPPPPPTADEPPWLRGPGFEPVPRESTPVNEARQSRNPPDVSAPSTTSAPSAPAPATDPRPQSGRTAVLKGGGFVDSVTIRVAGAADATFTLQGDQVTLSGGCDGRSPISLSFSRGNVAREDAGWIYLGFDTATVVGTGDMGTFGLTEVRWDHGTRVQTIGGREIRLPNRFSGPGTLTLTAHDATMAHATSGARRMTGTVRADALSNRTESVRLEATFDVHLSCGVSR
jgi:hypothetical protein